MALALLSAGYSRAGGHSGFASRVGTSDAQKLAGQRADAEQWLAERHAWKERNDRGRHRLLREVAWRAAGPSLEVDGGRNGGVVVTGWGRDSIHVVARVQAEARSLEQARALAGSVRIVHQGGRLTAEGDDDDDDASWSVTFDVLVPRTMALRLAAHNGPVCVADVNARIEAETVNGPVALSGLSGDVRARTQNGPIAVSLTGTRWLGAGLDASTQNGPVALVVPRGYSCLLETGTINGPMSMGFPVTIEPGITVGRRHLTTKLGGGGPRIRVVTNNGPAVVRHVGDPESEGDDVEF